MISPPKDSTFSAADWQVLAACWHPVAWSGEVGSKPFAVTLLDERLVLYRTTDGRLVAVRDLCLHRGVPLSAGWVEQDHLVCAYHGFRYAPDGRCVHIPGAPETAVPTKLCLTTFAAAERYGIVWVRLTGPDRAPLPEWPEAEAPGFRRMALTDLAPWNAAAARILENFLDVAHFSWIHTGTFGNRSLPEVAKYEVVPRAHGLHVEYPYLAANPTHSPLSGTSATIQRWMTYDVTYPFAARLLVDYEGGRRHAIFEANSPVSARKSRIFFFIAVNYDHDRSDEEFLDWERRVVGEDRPIVEAQRPEDLPLDLSEEFHLRFDRLSTAYRQGLRSMGLVGAR
jgi:phenylpropionate dioxygenase-like ring-hydroxylating dioxygenase large terminal subunit